MMKKTKIKRQKILLHENHIKIMRFLLDEFNKKNNGNNEYTINAIAIAIDKEQTETKEWLLDLYKYQLINIEERDTKGKTKRYYTYITKDESSFIKSVLDIFEKFCK